MSSWCGKDMIALVSRAALSSRSTALQSYSTSFPNTENPISESGKWTNGSLNGFNHDVRTTPGLAFATTIVSSTDDNCACLTTSFHGDQYAQGTIFRAGGYTPPDSHELELLTRFVINGSIARGYETTVQFGGFQVVKWLGGTFRVINTFNTTGNPANGDVWKVTATTSAGTVTITVFKNGTQVGQVTDDGSSEAIWSDGQPGIGFFPRTGATLASMGWSAFSAGEL